METIRVGIIGVGQIGKSHLRNYTTKVPAARIVAAADVDENELTKVCDQFGIQHRYRDFRELLQRDDIDAVDVCLHNNYHAPVTIEALRAGKHVYCEKPMAGSYVDAAAMFETARQTGRQLSIQLSTLFSRECKIAKRLIDAGRLGRVYHAHSTGYRRRGRPFVDGYGTASFVKKRIASGGALYDMGVYHIAQMLYLLGCPPVERISGKIYQELPMDERRRRDSGYDVEEMGLGFVRFADGLTLDIIECWAIHLSPLESSFILGSLGGLRLHPLSFHTSLEDIESNVTFEAESTDVRWRRLNENEEAFDSAQQHWIAALQGRVNLLPTAELALQTMLISEGIYLSDARGCEVSAEEVRQRSVSTAVQL